MSLPSTVDAATRRRETALWQGAGASVVAKAVSALCQLAQVPIAVGYLGAELFGLWMTLAGALAMMAFADFGIGAGVQNEAAMLVGKDRADEAKKTCVNGLAVLGVVGLCLAVALCAGCLWLPWAGWIGVKDAATTEDARTGLLVLIILFCANLPLTALARLAYGLQLGWLANAWYAAINLITLAAVIAASGGRLGFAGFVAMAAVPPVIGHIALGTHLFAKTGWRISSLPKPDTAGMMRLCRAGLPFTLPQLWALALIAVPPVLISSVLGTAWVAAWTLCQRLLGFFSVIQTVFLAQLWAAFSEAHARGDYAWMAKSYRRSVAGTVVFMVLPQCMFVWWGVPAVSIWSRGGVEVSELLALGFGVQAALFSLGQPPGYLLNSVGRMSGLARYGLLSTLMGLAGMVWGLPRCGVAAAPGALSLAWLLIFLPASYREAGQVLKGMRGSI